MHGVNYMPTCSLAARLLTRNLNEAANNDCWRELEKRAGGETSGPPNNLDLAIMTLVVSTIYSHDNDDNGVT
jgi:hypothetical protein